jgi:hypothetical protein
MSEIPSEEDRIASVSDPHWFFADPAPAKI